MWRAILILVLLAPAAAVPPQGEKSKPPSRPGPRIRTDANGWPIPVVPQRLPAGQTSDQQPREPLKRRRADPSDLAEVFQQVGRPEDAAGLQCVVAWITMTLFDHRGAELCELQVHHEADLRCTRDRLLFSRAGRGPDRVYGRDGRSVFAERHGMAWPSLEPRAREELEAFGVLLRMPWAFADREQFVVKGRDEHTVGGRAMVRLRIGRRPAEGAAVQQERFDLICPRDRMEPVEVHIRRPATGTTVVRLSRYASYRGVRIPTHRVFVGPDGYRRMEMRITRLDVGQDLPRSQFRPHQR